MASTPPPQTIDAHFHLSDERLFSHASATVSQARQTGVIGFVMGGTHPEEWDRQTQMAAAFPETCFPVLGLHPWWAARLSPAQIQECIHDLESKLTGAYGIGEMGLDFSKHFPEPTRSPQIEALRMQLELASRGHLPIVLHAVYSHKEVLQELQRFICLRPLRGIVHAFCADTAIAKKYLDLGLNLSIGAALLPKHAPKKSQELAKTLTKLPLERMVFESDMLGPATLLEIIREAASIIHTSTDALLVQNRNSVIQLFDLPLELA